MFSVLEETKVEQPNQFMKKTLYREQFEHDACGIGAVVSIDGIPSYSIVDDALSIVEKLEHRAGKDGSGTIGDGVGILLQISGFSRMPPNLSCSPQP